MVRSTKRPRIIQSLGKELYPEELQACTLPDGTIGEKGQLIIQTEPYCFLTEYSSGATHETPYNYDTHVPLIFYQSGSIERAQIYDRVTSLQCAPTIAHILGIPKPSACTAPLLPAIAPTNDPCF